MNDPLLLLCYMSILFAANVLGAVGGFGAGMISIPFLTQLTWPMNGMCGSL